MTPNERDIIRVVEQAADDIVAGLDRQRIPTTTGFAISFSVALTMLDRLDAETRNTITPSLIARLAQGRRLDA